MDKENEVTSGVQAISTTLLEATSNLAENLVQSEAFLRFRAAEGKLNADPEALRLMTDLSELQQKFRTQQHTGAITDRDFKQLRVLQSAIVNNEKIQDYDLTRELAVAFLREVNQEISQLLGIDFASLTRRSGGCC